MSLIAQAQIMYGVPPINPSGQFQSLYGVNTFSSPISIILSMFFTPFVVIISFVIGTVLYLITHKKLFIIIPLVMALIYLVRSVFGI